MDYNLRELVLCCEHHAQAKMQLKEMETQQAYSQQTSNFHLSNTLSNTSALKQRKKAMKSKKSTQHIYIVYVELIS